MGIIRRQTFYNGLISYTGVALGALNILFLFPLLAGEQQMGLTLVYMSIAAVLVQFMSIGLPNVLVRFFPSFRAADLRHKGFFTWAFYIALVGFGVGAAVFVALRPVVEARYASEGSLFSRYYLWMLPIALGLLAFTLLEAVATTLFRTVFSAFLREVLLRLLTAAALLLLGFGYVSFDIFLALLAASYFIVSVLQLAELSFSKQFSAYLPPAQVSRAQHNDMLRYGAYSLLAGASLIFIQNIDKIMLGSMVSFVAVSVYARFANMGVVVSIPARALGRIARAVVAEAWARDDIGHLQDVYRRSSITQMVAGAFVFLLLWLNMPFILTLVDRTGDLNAHAWVFFWIGLSFWVDMTGGINALILATSKLYRWDIYFNLAFVALHVLLNILIIPAMGVEGAALAVALAYTCINFAKWAFVKIRFGMDPLYRGHLIVLGISVALLILVPLIPAMENMWVDAVLRSLLIAIIFGAAILLLPISPDLHTAAFKVWHTVKRLLRI